MIYLRLKEERERLGLTQPVFAELAGAAKRTVIDWEKGVSSPTAAQLAAVASAGADVLYVVTGQRAQAAAEVELLPPDERVLVDAYRRCNADAKRNLIQTAALLSAGMGSAHAPDAGVNQTSRGSRSAQKSASINKGVHVGGNVSTGAVIVRGNVKGGIKRGPENI